MAVPVNKARQQRLAAELHQLRRCALGLEHVRLRADGENFPILHRERLGGRRCVVDRDNFTASVDRVGSGGSKRRGALRTAGDEKQRAQGGACGLE